MQTGTSRDPRTAEIIAAAGLPTSFPPACHQHACIEVHRTLGPGLLESLYEECLCRELQLRDIPFRRQVPVAVGYKGVDSECGYRIDILVYDEVVIEVKAVEAVHPVHEAQLLTYMRLANKRVGLLINFCVPVLKDGIKRRVL